MQCNEPQSFKTLLLTRQIQRIPEIWTMRQQRCRTTKIKSGITWHLTYVNFQTTKIFISFVNIKQLTRQKTKMIKQLTIGEINNVRLIVIYVVIKNTLTN